MIIELFIIFNLARHRYTMRIWLRFGATTTAPAVPDVNSLRSGFFSVR